MLGLTNSFAFCSSAENSERDWCNCCYLLCIGFIIMNIVDGAPLGLTSVVSIIVGQSLGATDPKRVIEVAYRAFPPIFFFLALEATVIYSPEGIFDKSFTDNPRNICRDKLIS